MACRFDGSSKDPQRGIKTQDGGVGRVARGVPVIQRTRTAIIFLERLLESKQKTLVEGVVKIHDVHFIYIGGALFWKIMLNVKMLKKGWSGFVGGKNNFKMSNCQWLVHQ